MQQRPSVVKHKQRQHNAQAGRECAGSYAVLGECEKCGPQTKPLLDALLSFSQYRDPTTTKKDVMNALRIYHGLQHRVEEYGESSSSG